VNYSEELIEIIKEIVSDVGRCECEQKKGTPMYGAWFYTHEYNAEIHAKIQMGLITHRIPISLPNWKITVAGEYLKVTLKFADFSGGWDVE